MKSAVVYIVLVVTIAWAALLRAEKNADTNNSIDKVAGGLKGIDVVLPVDRRISTKLWVDNTPYFLTRYLLAPRFVSYPDNEKYDTMLFFFDVNANESMVNAITGDKRVLWQNKDDRYHYVLTCKN